MRKDCRSHDDEVGLPWGLIVFWMWFLALFFIPSLRATDVSLPEHYGTSVVDDFEKRVSHFHPPSCEPDTLEICPE